MPILSLAICQTNRHLALHHPPLVGLTTSNGFGGVVSAARAVSGPPMPRTSRPAMACPVRTIARLRRTQFCFRAKDSPSTKTTIDDHRLFALDRPHGTRPSIKATLVPKLAQPEC